MTQSLPMRFLVAPLADDPPPVPWDSLKAHRKWKAEKEYSGVALVARWKSCQS
jgi:hypothetical protein